MSVLRSMCERVAERVDAVARKWLSRPTAKDDVTPAELMVVRRVGLGAVVALPLFPAALATLVPASIALPAGSALALAGALFSGVAGIALVRRIAGDRPDLTELAPVRDPADDLAIYDRFVGLVTVHDRAGHVLAVRGRDQAAYTQWMRPLAGRGFLDHIHVSDRILFLRALDSLRQGAGSQSVELRFERATLSGEQTQFVHMRCDMTALCGPDDAMTVVVQTRDMSAEVLLRQEAAEKAAQAESANEAKRRFLAAVSHELRTPLNAIMGFSDVLAGEYFGRLENDRQREYVSLIHQSGSHLLSVVNTMLDMSRIEAGRYELIAEPFEVRGVVKACEAMLKLQAENKGVQLTSRIARSVGELNADRRAVQQILINLVCNAIKFTDRGGLVTVDAEADGDQIRLVVSDTGIGMAADKIALIGQPFMQIDNAYSRSYEGTGLGLALVKGLVALHGGRLTVESRPGEGTVMTVTLPVDGSGIVPQPEAQPVPPAPVEFPPRLTTRVDGGRQAAPGEVALRQGGTAHGPQAKSA
ncbi:two-component sensor histidine kinase [Rhizobium rhizosphaerae]|uniref:histidine kinase n=2 Tax=Xaviernesmea rhizosphaerae TaxID=1672749 RepID=A0A1Q9ADP4_9HYPH|nr:two-component sensor histidine kinase [Xaviernesmea rhizosphaerae]